MIVFFDLDGTIVDDATQIIPDSAISAIEALNRNGHLAIVNTGRPLGHVDPRIRKIAFQGWICSCGMEVLFENQWLYRNMPSPQVCQFVVDSVRKCRMQVLYEDADRMYRDGIYSNAPRPVHQARKIQARGIAVEEISSLPEPKFIKFVTHSAPGCRQNLFLDLIAPYFTAIDRGRGMMEYMLKGCSKAGGIRLLAEYLRIPDDQILAIGDSTNDLPMFAAAGHTVCMGNGMEEVKSQAEFVTSGVLEDGIERALKHYCLL